MLLTFDRRMIKTCTACLNIHNAVVYTYIVFIELVPCSEKKNRIFSLQHALNFLGKGETACFFFPRKETDYQKPCSPPHEIHFLPLKLSTIFNQLLNTD